MSLRTEGIHSHSMAVTQHEQSGYYDKNKLDQVAEIWDEALRAQTLLKYFKNHADPIAQKTTPRTDRPVIDLDAYIPA